MKGILTCSLLASSLFTLTVHADTVVPIGSNLGVSSPLIDGGRLVVGGSLGTQASNVLPAQAPVYLGAEGIFNLQDHQQSVGSISGSGIVHLGSEPLAPGSGLVRLGGGRLAIGENSGFAGATSGGTLTVGGVTVSSGGTYGGTLTVGAGGTLSGGATSGGTLTMGGVNAYYSSGAGLVLTSVGSSDTAIASTAGALLTTGNLVKSGAGTLTLSGINTYTGATTISAGTLNLTGTISGSGAVSVTGSGTLNLAGGTVASGTVAQNGGTVAFSDCIGASLSLNLLGSGGAISNLTGGTLTIGDSFVLLDAGQEALWSNSNGIITLSGSGGTPLGSFALSGSTFTVTVEANPPQGRMFAPMGFAPVSSSNGVLITGNDNSNQVFSGSISGNGDVVKVGTGVWALTGSNSYTGLTTVADGALVVNGSVDSDVFVWGGVLGGSGRIGGSVLNQSVVSPGNSPGTLTIAGDYDQASTGVLWIQIASPTVYDRLVIGGAAHLDGTLVAELYSGFTLRRGQSFTILTAADGVTGRFAGAFVNTNTLLSLGVVYLPDRVVLETVQGSFAYDVPGLTPNQFAVARALDKVVDSKRVSGLVDELDSLPLGALPGALEKIVPTNLLAMFDASIASATVQADNLERRMQEIRDGSTGVSTDGLHLSDSHGKVSGKGGGEQAIGKDGKELAPAPLSDRWGYFVNGSGEFVDAESTAIAQGSEFTTGGISAGADYRFCDRAVAGVTAGYSNTATDSRDDSSVKTNSGKLGLYGTVFDRGFFVNGGIAGGINSYDTKRDTLGGNARGETNGNEFNTLLGTGYTYRTGGWSLGPIASLRYSWVGIDGFTERGSLAPLRFGDQSEDSLRSTAGLQASYAFTLCKVVVKPMVRAQWQHEYLEAARSIGASFLPGGAFNVFGPEIGRDSLLLDAGVTVQVTPQVGVYAGYTGDLGRDDYSSQSVNGGVQLSF